MTALNGLLMFKAAHRFFTRRPDGSLKRSRSSVSVVMPVILLVFAAVVASSGQESSGVLILNSYHPGYAWSDGEQRGLLKTLMHDQPLLLPSIEYLDWKRHPTKEQEDIFIEMLKVRYASANLRMVVTLDDKAFELALQNRSHFGDVPIIFGGVNQFDPSAYNVPLTNLTGIVESKDFERTFDLIQRLQPDVREIVAYHDNTESSLATRRGFEDAIRQYAPTLKYRFIENWTTDELLDGLSRLPPHSVAFSLGANRDRNGVLLTDDMEFLKAVAARSSVPVYNISEPIVPLFSEAGWNEGVWSGVGGSLVSGERHGEQVGGLVLRVLKGERADSIPVITNSAGRLDVDLHQMKRFNLPFKALPEGTEIYNQPENFYRVNKTRILLGTSVLVGIAVSAVFLAVNIMLRRRAERENVRLGAAVEQACEIVIMLDASGAVSHINPAFEQITGWSEKTARETSLDCLGVAGGETLRQVIDRLRKQRRGSEPLSCFHKDGRLLQLSIAGSDLYDAAGNPDGFILLIRDVTREAGLEEQVRNAQKMEAIGLLAGGVAHDFNNLLQVILGHTQLAMDPTVSEEERAYCLAHILSAVKRGAQRPRQLLMFGRRQPVHVQDTNLNNYISSSLEIFNKLIGEHIEVCFTPSPEVGNVRADQSQLEQVVLNLCINARDAMPDVGKLTFRVENVALDEKFCDAHAWARPGDYVRLSVEDTGCGMDKETLDRIFEPFFTTKPIDKGTGLGLAVVYGIIQQHNGLIEVRSTPGSGTAFSIYLPRVAPQNMEPERVADNGYGTSVSATILLAEDEEIVRSLCKRVLNHAGYEVLEARNGLEAVCCFSENADRINLVIMDMVMPKMSGLTAGEQIAEIRSEVPILFSSGYSPELDAPNKPRMVIQKPYDMAELLSRVSEVLSSGAR